jgi:hypothetical protein
VRQLHQHRGKALLTHSPLYPKSDFTFLPVGPLASELRTNLAWNLFNHLSPIVRVLCFSKCHHRSGIELRQVHRKADSVSTLCHVLTGVGDLQTELFERGIYFGCVSGVLPRAYFEKQLRL